MEYRRVCAIDAGTRNFAYCILDSATWNQPPIWATEDLWEPKAKRGRKPTKEQVIQITVEWCRRHKAEIDACDLVILETQLRTTFIVMNAVIHALFFDKIQQISPMTIASFFHLPRTREQKKAATVEFCKANCAMPVAKKVDDLADAWQMAVYALIKAQGMSIKQLHFVSSSSPFLKCGAAPRQ